MTIWDRIIKVAYTIILIIALLMLIAEFVAFFTMLGEMS